MGYRAMCSAWSCTLSCRAQHCRAPLDLSGHLLRISGNAWSLTWACEDCSEQKDDPDEAKLLDEMKAYGDIWRIDMVDTYADLALKTLKMFSILPARVDADFYFKVDDDVAMNVGAMAEYLQSKRTQGNLYLVRAPVVSDLIIVAKSISPCLLACAANRHRLPFPKGSAVLDLFVWYKDDSRGTSKAAVNAHGSVRAFCSHRSHGYHVRWERQEKGCMLGLITQRQDPDVPA